jgi:hypothetical protein
LSSIEKLERPSTVLRAFAARDAAKDVGQLDPFKPPFQRILTWVLLIELALTAWVFLVSHRHTTEMPMAAGLRATHFLTDWTVMMAAMMFPAAALMIVAFYKDQAVKRSPEDAFVSTWVFVTAYLLVWVLVGTAAYAGMLVAESAAAHSALGPVVALQFGGAILLAAGILAEKTLPWPIFASYTVGVVLVLYGAVLIASPLLTTH